MFNTLSIIFGPNGESQESVRYISIAAADLPPYATVIIGGGQGEPYVVKRKLQTTQGTIDGPLIAVPYSWPELNPLSPEEGNFDLAIRTSLEYDYRGYRAIAKENLENKWVSQTSANFSSLQRTEMPLTRLVQGAPLRLDIRKIMRYPSQSVEEEHVEESALARLAQYVPQNGVNLDHFSFPSWDKNTFRGSARVVFTDGETFVLSSTEIDRKTARTLYDLVQAHMEIANKSNINPINNSMSRLETYLG